ncbi:MAG: 23S rRNA (pseudouridine(1915)-N(3))-methyltransferase RlmH [Porticoccaceae bacterium]|jgi:23S rRNA (pseudouridine1915-N3)-methyltransferase|nr:23S rRNA (pseudouridine(1915)-N(3))-methyltransferase RlmH [Porticoccaceae bacterium]MEA3300738.1 23S rRNA (pseudouridine(1915)-N(3))-methyltransferase RlmH [Pseudomonadota bacterium]HLS98647.1 23S rRNA (pseudouridine(1915)-N(3))-methyltransferase RlmH [Porticoccaceae bacterium]
MRLRILAVGTRMPGWVTEGFNEYRKRLPPEIRVELVELPLGPRGKGQPLERAMEREGEAMLKAIQPGDGVIALDVPGKPWSTEQLAHQLRAWQESGKNHNLLIGGPDGLPPACLARADQSWSLSPLTLPHPLVRILLIEQLYRAWSLNAGHPYHK